MKTAILCGGRGLRLGEHGRSIPKALLDVGGRPVLWHVLKLYAHYGLSDFVLCLGFLGQEIERYFMEHHARDSHFVLGTTCGAENRERQPASEPAAELAGDRCTIEFASTGLDTNTGGRLHAIRDSVGNDANFCATYCDGLADLNLRDLLRFHQSHGRIATLTAVNPASAFGLLKIDNRGSVTEFLEKPRMTDWINGGFFVFRREIFDYLSADSVLEREPLERLAREGQLMAYKHGGFWACLDTYKDHVELNRIWQSGEAKWKLW